MDIREALPEEILCYLFEFFDFTTLLVVEQVCASFREAATNPYLRYTQFTLWKNQAEEDLPANYNASSKPSSSRFWLLHAIRQKSIASKFKSALERDGIVCCRTGDTNRLKQWLKHGGDPVKVSVIDDMVSPLLVACKHNQSQCVKIIAEHLKDNPKKCLVDPYETTSRNPHSVSPSLYCIETGNIECLDHLLANKYISLPTAFVICNHVVAKLSSGVTNIGGHPVHTNPKVETINKVKDYLRQMDEQRRASITSPKS